MIEQARFDELIREGTPKLRNVLRKMVGDRHQVDDLAQEALLKAWQARDSFGERSAFSTWLCSIGVRCALDFLRSQKRWRAKAQVHYAHQCMARPDWGQEVGAALHDPSATFEAQEHIAYCFACLGRSLDPMDQACLVLKEILGLTGQEGATALGVTEPVFRHHLSRARASMEGEFEGLCALVNKGGVCHQCRMLREGAPKALQGEWPQDLDLSLSLERRIEMVKEAALDKGRTQKLHDLFWERTLEVEDLGLGDDSEGACPPS